MSITTPIRTGEPSRLEVWMSHGDKVVALPEGFELLASTESAPVAAMQDTRRGRARWHNDSAKPIEWEYDGGRYRPTEIVRRILVEAAGIERSVRGPSWWVLEDGHDLPALAGSPQKSSFDWSQLHTLMAALPRGRWTTYGDVASVIGTARVTKARRMGPSTKSWRRSCMRRCGSVWCAVTADNCGPHALCKFWPSYRASPRQAGHGREACRTARYRFCASVWC